MEQTQELIQVIQEAQNGYWIPASIVGGFLSVIMALLVYIWNKTTKEYDAKHTNSSEMMQKLIDLQDSQQVLLARFETKLEYHDKAIDELKSK